MRLHHVSIPVGPEELDEARAFYSGAFGLQEVPSPATLGPQRVAWFDMGGRELHLFIEDGANLTPSGRHLAFEVDDLEAARQRLIKHGVDIEVADPEIYNRPRFFCHDPFGNRIEVTRIVGPYQ
ncbi:MAG TPA: VOC family protein [Thermomicrobiales bacterium]|nr:VOC family protein [Thermomicrobiales bacterium]